MTDRRCARTRTMTERRTRILHLVSLGLTNKEIAAAVGTSQTAVESVIVSLLQHFNVRNRVQLALRAHGIEVSA